MNAYDPIAASENMVNQIGATSQQQPRSMNLIPSPIESGRIDHPKKSDRNSGDGITEGSEGPIIITPHLTNYSSNQYYGTQFYPTIGFCRI